MPVRLWALIVSSRWVVVIPIVVKMDLTLSSGSIVPPALAPVSAAASPSDPAASGLTAIVSSILLKYWRACHFASVSPSQGCCPNLRWVPLPDLCRALLLDLCRAL